MAVSSRVLPSKRVLQRSSHDGIGIGAGAAGRRAGGGPPPPAVMRWAIATLKPTQQRHLSRLRASMSLRSQKGASWGVGG